MSRVVRKCESDRAVNKNSFCWLDGKWVSYGGRTRKHSVFLGHEYNKIPERNTTGFVAGEWSYIFLLNTKWGKEKLKDERQRVVVVSIVNISICGKYKNIKDSILWRKQCCLSIELVFTKNHRAKLEVSCL